MSLGRQLQEAANAMIAAAERGRPVVPVLKKLCPYVHDQLLRDARCPGLLSLWGRSVNVDENTGEVIVHPAILHAIGELAGVPMRGRVVHAGLQHSYGYLFSLIDTPYGAKRDRWVSTELERAFGLGLSLLGPRPRRGTLLANLTWFLGHVVYRGCPEMLRRLEENAAAVAPTLVRYDFARLAVCRVVEHVTLTGERPRQTFLTTDLVPFPRRPSDHAADRALLVYSVRAGSRSAARLVTGFPVRPTVVQDIKASVPARGGVEVRPRYNAYVPGLDGRTVRGRRSFAEPGAC